MQRENILSKRHTCKKIKEEHIYHYMYKNGKKILNVIETYKIKTFVILVVCLPLVKLFTTIDVNTCKLTDIHLRIKV